MLSVPYFLCPLFFDITSVDLKSGELRLIEVKDPARFEWHEVTKVQHYWLEVNAMTRPMQVREDERPYNMRSGEWTI